MASAASDPRTMYVDGYTCQGPSIAEAENQQRFPPVDIHCVWGLRTKPLPPVELDIGVQAFVDYWFSHLIQ